MSNFTDEIGAVKFGGGEIFIAEYDVEERQCFPQLYPLNDSILSARSIHDVYDVSQRNTGCSDKSHFRTSVHIMVRGIGSWWGNACSTCRRLTSGLSSHNQTFTEGEPAWSPWIKKQNAKYHVEPIAGFSMSDWLDDYKTENKEEHYENENETNRNGEFIRDPNTGEIVRDAETGELARFKTGEVSIDPQSGQILRFDAKTGKWKPDNHETTTPVGYVRGVSPDDVPF